MRPALVVVAAMSSTIVRMSVRGRPRQLIEIKLLDLVPLARARRVVRDGGRDTLFGDAGNDLLCGEAGRDLLFGEEGADEMYGVPAVDKMPGGVGDDFLDGGFPGTTESSVRVTTTPSLGDAPRAVTP